MEKQVSRKNNKDSVLQATGMRKSFNRVEVLHGVDFVLKRGEVHGIVGQNGAGKSTLMKIINGVYTRDEGILHINGVEVQYDTPIGARQHGISMVYQEFSLIPSMSVAENLFLSREPLKGIFIDEQYARKKAYQLFKELEINIRPDALVSQLPVGERQLVEIVKALTQDMSILIMDEPTASLSNIEIKSLFRLIRRLKQEGISIIFVSHHLNEVMEICDRVTVIRDGRVVLDDSVAKLKLEDVITAIIGQRYIEKENEIKKKFQRHECILEVEKLGYKNRYKDISFRLFPGEVLGIAGVLGCGSSELLKTLYGVLKPDCGKIKLHGLNVFINHPAIAINRSIIHVPEDRRRDGILGSLSVRSNILLPIWERISKFGFVQEKKGVKIVNKFIDDLKIKTTNIDQLVKRLSGGNQQKVVFAKSLSTQPNILLLDDPTVGVDVGTKDDIAQIIRKIVSLGNAVILVSSEMGELADLSDRVLVMQKGRIIREIDCYETGNVDEEYLMNAIQNTNSHIKKLKIVNPNKFSI